MLQRLYARANNKTNNKSPLTIIGQVCGSSTPIEFRLSITIKRRLLMAQFDSRTINATPRQVSGTPILFGLGLLLLILMLWSSMAYVPPGNVGVLVNFGRVTGETLPAGTHFVSP